MQIEFSYITWEGWLRSLAFISQLIVPACSPTFEMNVGSLLASSVRRNPVLIQSRYRSAISRPSTGGSRRLVVSKPSVSTRYRNCRALFGFTFAPKQQEPTVTDGLAAYGINLPKSDPNDTSDQFNKNPVYLTKSDAKGEYGFYRKETDAGTRGELNWILILTIFDHVQSLADVLPLEFEPRNCCIEQNPVTGDLESICRGNEAKKLDVLDFVQTALQRRSSI